MGKYLVRAFTQGTKCPSEGGSPRVLNDLQKQNSFFSSDEDYFFSSAEEKKLPPSSAEL